MADRLVQAERNYGRAMRVVIDATNHRRDCMKLADVPAGIEEHDEALRQLDLALIAEEQAKTKASRLWQKLELAKQLYQD